MLTPRIESRDQILLAGLTESYRKSDRRDIPAQWTRFLGLLDDIKGPIGDGGFGLSLVTQTPGMDFDYMAAVGIRSRDHIPPSLIGQVIPAGNYAIFDHNDYIQEIGALCDEVLGNWLPNGSYELRKGDLELVEHYRPDFDPAKKGGVSLWVPICD